MTGNRGKYFRVVAIIEIVERKGRTLSLLPISKLGLLLVERYYIPKGWVVVLTGHCPTNEESCHIGVIVLGGRWPEGILVLGRNWQSWGWGGG